MNEKIRILLVDDHNVIRHGLRLLMEACADMEVVGEAENGREAVELAEKLQPHIVILDIVMPMLNGEDALPDPLTYDATGIAGNQFSYNTPPLSGCDAYSCMWTSR